MFKRKELAEIPNVKPIAAETKKQRAKEGKQRSKQLRRSAKQSEMNAAQSAAASRSAVHLRRLRTVCNTSVCTKATFVRWSRDFSP